MNIVSPSFIRDYVLENFGSIGKFSANDVEFIMPSIFIKNDWKKHFSINTDSGLWQDFKAGRSGNFIHFYAHYENISYREAKGRLLFKDLEYEEPVKSIKKKESKITEFPNFLEEGVPVHVGSHDNPNKLVQKAWCLLFERKLFNLSVEEYQPFYLATSGKYKNRLIIPFKNPDGGMFYFQARALENEQPKYLNPIDSPVKPSHILYPFNEESPFVVVCEGPLDAISLQLQGINATCTMGCSISDTQINMLRDFQGDVIVGYDNDGAGTRGLLKFEELRKYHRMPNIFLCPPPKPYKDWNEAHVNDLDLKAYVEDSMVKYDFSYRLASSL